MSVQILFAARLVFYRRSKIRGDCVNLSKNKMTCGGGAVPDGPVGEHVVLSLDLCCTQGDF